MMLCPLQREERFCDDGKVEHDPVGYGTLRMKSSALERIGRHLLSFTLMGLAVYVGLIFLVQGKEFRDALQSFSLINIPLLLSLACLNYVLRYGRWQIYLRALDIRINPWRSFQIFMAGLTMTVTPGKAGEAMKAHLLSREGDFPWSMGLPVVFAERLTDLLGVVVLVALGLKVLPVSRGVVLVGAGLCTLLIVVFTHPALFKKAVRLLGRIPKMAGPSQKMLDLHANIKQLLAWRLLAAGVAISCLAWFAECLVLFFVQDAFPGRMGLLQAVFTYALATLAGALSILPGGLVATEGSMTGLLIFFGMGGHQGALTTIIVRLCTLWFAVLLGMVFLFFLRRQQRFQAAPSQLE
jgi:uncharacterized protein (TIRG00374 family)